MTQKFTAEEVREKAHGYSLRGDDRTAAMLNAYADTLSKPASPMQVDIYPLPDSLYPQSKDWMAADYAGRVEWLHAMYENRKDELDCFLAAQGQGEAAAEVYEGAFGVHYLGCADPSKLPVGTKLYTAPPASRHARQVPEPWYPTTYNINRLPNPVRKYIMQLETNADPAGMVRENVLCSEENKMLRALVSEYVDAPGSFARGSAAIRIADMLAAPSAPEGDGGEG